LVYLAGLALGLAGADFFAVGFFAAGFAAGLAAVFAAGFTVGFLAGFAAVFVAGLAAGFAAVFAAGFATGFAVATGFAAGLADGFFAAGFFAAGFLTAAFLAAGFLPAGFAPFADLRSYTFLPATAAAAVAITAPATAADFPGLSLMAVPAVAAALEAESTADLAVVDAVSAAERALPVRASVKLRKLFNNVLNTPASVGFFGISRSSFGCNAMMNILWRRVRSCVLIGMAVR
jgi:hypothetical protein